MFRHKVIKNPFTLSMSKCEPLAVGASTHLSLGKSNHPKTEAMSILACSLKFNDKEVKDSVIKQVVEID